MRVMVRLLGQDAQGTNGGSRAKPGRAMACPGPGDSCPVWCWQHHGPADPREPAAAVASCVLLALDLGSPSSLLETGNATDEGESQVVQCTFPTLPPVPRDHLGALPKPKPSWASPPCRAHLPCPPAVPHLPEKLPLAPCGVGVALSSSTKNSPFLAGSRD